MSDQISFKHRANEPLEVPAARTVNPGAHREGRNSDLPVAAALGIILILVAAYLAMTH